MTRKTSSSKAAIAMLPSFLTALAGIGLLVAPASASSLLPHRAVYELSLVSADSEAGIAGAAGLFIFQATGSACAGWQLESTLVLTIEGRSGRQQQTRSSYSAFEASDGSAFTFESAVQTDGVSPERSLGEAVRQDNSTLSIEGEHVEGDAGGDETQRMLATSAPSETLFPNALTAHLLQAAQDGESLVFGTVFDGTHDNGLAQPFTATIGAREIPTVTEAIRARRQLSEERGDNHRGWDDFPKPTEAWPVTLRYFDPDRPDTGPSFTVSYLLDTNGVSENVTLAYEAFSLGGTLSDFEAFRPESCAD